MIIKTSRRRTEDIEKRHINRKQPERTSLHLECFNELHGSLVETG